MSKPTVLIVMDGWGIAPDSRGNAVTRAKKPNFDMLWKKFPNTTLKASGSAVGMPEGTQGNSEVGHIHMGAGRVVWQPLARINDSIEDGSFFRNENILGAIIHAKRHDSTLHLMGICSDGNVHGSIDHLITLLKMAAENKVKKVAIHCFLDGRDVPDRSAGIYIKKIEAATKKYGIGKIATLIGRYYAMDRDGNYDRTMVAYDMLVDAKGRECKDPLQAIAEEYKSGAKTDYYVNPIVIVNGNGVPIASLHRDDAAIFFNYRVDRAKQLTNAVKGRYFTEFPRLRIENLYFTCMSEFVGELRAPVAFRAVNAENNFGEVLSKNKIKQLRISETEKYAHVTYFFNSQVEKPYKGEERILVPSPKVPSYDMKPDMSAYEVTEKVLECLDSGKYGFVLLNYANCDLVGHSSVLSATIKAVEVVDECMGKVVGKVLEKKGTALVTADHGNAECKINSKGEESPSHTTNPVPFILVSEKPDLKNAKLAKGGSLIDIAPTILDIMNIKKPQEMTGESLILKQ